MASAGLTAAAKRRVRVSVILAGLAIVAALAAGSAEAGARRTFHISPTSFDFGDVGLGATSAAQTLTVTNVSSVTVLVSLTGGGAGPFGGAEDCQSRILGPGESCLISYAFTPAALGPAAGSAAGTINGQSFSLSFAGNGVRSFRISPTSFDFGDVAVGTGSPLQTVSVTNVSSTPVFPSLSGGASGTGRFVVGDSCQLTLSPGQSCQIVYRFAPATVGPVTETVTGSINGQIFAIALRGVGYRAENGDLDGDGKADPAVYRSGEWVFQGSATNYQSTMILWGEGIDRPVPGDYDGDGKTDLTVFRPMTGEWLVLESSNHFTTNFGVQWGTSGDIPVPGDFDGDGRTDFAVFRPSDGTWYILNSSSGTARYVHWGSGADVPVRGDFDGDGKADIAVFRPSDGTWYIIRSSSGAAFSVQWGSGSDQAVPADYDGDGRTDIAVFRPSEGIWYILHSSTGMGIAIWGISTDVTVPADYDGDGRADIAVWRQPASATVQGTWFIVSSISGSQISFVFGLNGDVPIPATYFGRWMP